MTDENIHYSPWVNHKKLIRGDTCLVKRQGKWVKCVYNGNVWIDYDTASKQLVTFADIRAKVGSQVKALRKA